MLARLALAVALVLTFAGPAAALPGPTVGTYDMEWSILHVPVSSDLPDLQDGTTRITLEAATGGICPPTSAFVVKNAPASSAEGGSTTWCIKSDGSFDGSAGGEGSWNQYTNDVAFIEADNRRGNDHLQAVARRVVTPPPSSVKVFITQPHNGDTVSGTNWVVLWADGTSGSSNVYTIAVDGTVVGTQNGGSSKGPISIPWNTKVVANGTHTIKATVQDATGATATASISVLVNN
jgi:hypothetical protein